MVTRHTVVKLDNKKYEVAVTQNAATVSPLGSRHQTYFIHDMNGRLLFKIVITKFPDRTQAVIGIECIGDHEYDEIGFIARGPKVEDIFQACMFHVQARINKDKRKSRLEHVAHVSNLCAQCNTRTQLQAALHSQGYVDAYTKQAAERRYPIGDAARDDGNYFVLTRKNAPIKFKILLDLVTAEARLHYA